MTDARSMAVIRWNFLLEETRVITQISFSASEW